MSVYAARYERIGKTCESDQDRLNDLIGASPQDPAAIEKQGQTSAADRQPSDAALLRVSWPSRVERDIRALVVADGPAIGDLNDLEGNDDNMQRDSGAANAAATSFRLTWDYLP